jgi:TetR/AcrR family transcriptional regulator, transcriptional repressor for nem operon
VKSHSPKPRGPKPKPGVREKIIQTGMLAMYTDGYNATGIQSIVETAEIPKGSFYNHFESKEAFGAEVADAYYERALARLQRVLGEPQVAPLKKLETYFGDIFEILRGVDFTRGCLLANLTTEIGDHSPLIRERIAEHLVAWSKFFEDCIAEAQKQKMIRNKLPADVLGRFVLNCWEGTLVRMRAEKTDAAYREFKQVIFGVVLV